MSLYEVQKRRAVTTHVEAERILDLQPQGKALHHIGFAFPSIKEVIGGFADSFGGHTSGEIIHDPLQQVRVTFLHSGGGPMLELVEPAGAGSPVCSFVERGGGLHHLCYEVEALEEQLALMRSQGGLIVKRPLPAVAFGGRRIAWVLTRYKVLLEYLER